MSSPSRCVEPADGPEAGEVCVVNPYIVLRRDASRAGTASPTAACDIAVLGVHRDGGMTGLLAVPAGNLVPRARP